MAAKGAGVIKPVQQLTKLMHPTSMQNRDQAQRPSVVRSTLRRLKWSTLELRAQFSTVPTTIKRKSHHTCKHVLLPGHVSMPIMCSVT